MSKREGLLNGLAGLAALAAVVTVALRLWPISGVRPDRPSHGDAIARKVDNWVALEKTGRRIGSTDARLNIIEFGDFQCPACAGFARVVDSMLAKHPNDVALIWHHFPLPYHPLARALARAAECAATQGSFAEFYRESYRRQGELGLITVNDVGLMAGVRDSVEFLRCAADTVLLESIEHYVAVAQAIGVPGTPTVIIDGMLYPGGGNVSVSDLERLLAHK